MKYLTLIICLPTRYLTYLKYIVHSTYTTLEPQSPACPLQVTDRRDGLVRHKDHLLHLLCYDTAGRSPSNPGCISN